MRQPSATDNNPRINTLAPAGILAGIWTAQKLSVPIILWPCAAALFLVLFLIFRKKAARFQLEQPVKKVARVLLVLLFFFSGGTWTALIHGASSTAATMESAPLPDKISLTGVIQQPPEIRTTRTSFEIRPDIPANEESLPFSGNVIAIRYDTDGGFRYGDRVRLTGKPTLIKAGSGASYFQYLRQQGFGVILYNPKIEKLSENNGNSLFALIFRLRQGLLEKVYRIYPAPENALMAGILLGDESQIPADIDEAFQKTGTAHVVAISGANFAVLTWLLLTMIRLIIPRWWSQLTLIPVIFFYAILTGGNPAILRAALMSSFTIFGLAIGRKTNGIRSMLWSVAAIALFNPGALFEISLQLSVTATAGILLFKDPLLEGVKRLLARFQRVPEPLRERVAGLLDELLLVSLAAQIFTIWISAAAFHQISWISLFANLLITPFQSIIMLGGLFSLLCGMIFEPLGSLAAALIWPAPAVTINAVRFCAEISWASGYASISNGTAWLIISLLMLGWHFRSRIRQWDREKMVQRGLALLFFLSIVLWVTVLDLRDTRLRISFSGSASEPQIEVRTPQHQIFIIASGATNYGANRLTGRNWLKTEQVAGLFIDFRERWMREKFITSADELPDCTYLDGIHPQPSLAIAANDLSKIRPGFHVQAGEVALDVPLIHLRKRVWQLHYQNLHLLIPMGIPPQTILKYERQDLIAGANLIVLRQEDDTAAWQEYLQRHFCDATQCTAPLAFNSAQYREPKIYSDGEKIWLFHAGDQ